jgi:hypothetical protein
MGKHTNQHGVSKYQSTKSELYRIEFPKDASERAKQLHAEVNDKLDEMEKVHKLAIEMLTLAEQVLRSDELLKRPKVIDRLKACFARDSLVGSAPAWDPMIKVVGLTRSGLQKDRRVKFTRLTGEQDEETGNFAYGAVKPHKIDTLQGRKRLQSIATKGDVEGWQRRLADARSDLKKATEDETDDVGDIEENVAFLEKKVVAVSKKHAETMETDAPWLEKYQQHTKHADIFLSTIKLDMFTFTQRIGRGEHDLVARSLVHEATHRHAGTEDHSYMRPDGSAPKKTVSDYTEKPITPEDWLENADSYAYFAYGLILAKRFGENFG